MEKMIKHHDHESYNFPKTINETQLLTVHTHTRERARTLTI